jgi:opacity protein-like surface antigen
MKLQRNLLATGIAVAGLTVLSSGAMAQDFYVSGSLGLINQGDSSNAGIFTSAFTTGEVTGVTPPLTIPAGSGVNWNTEFDRGNAYSLAIGTNLMGFRVELEYRDTDSDVDTHRGVNAAGLDLSAIDAGVLIGGNVGDLGVSVANLVAAGQGQLESSSIMVNGFYDFDLDGAFTPYLGLGLGNSDSDVRYAPSNTPVLSGSDSGFAWQVIGGVSYEISESINLFLNYRYFDAGDFSVNSSLLPASFDIENNSQSLDFGLRFSF